MKKRKVIAIILILALIMSLMPLAAMANGANPIEPTVNITNASGLPGATVELVVSLDDFDYALSMMTFRLTYDHTRLDFDGYDWGASLDVPGLTFSQQWVEHSQPGLLRIAVVTDVGVGLAIPDADDLLTLSFTIRDGVAPGDIPLVLFYQSPEVGFIAVGGSFGPVSQEFSLNATNSGTITVLGVEAGDVLFREQRDPSQWFYLVGVGERDPILSPGTHGHYGTTAVINFVYETSTFYLDVSHLATQVAIDFAGLLTDRAAFTGTAWWVDAPGNVVDLETAALIYTTIDDGWETGHMPAYLVVGTPALGETRTLAMVVDGVAFYVVISKAAPTPTVTINFEAGGGTGTMAGETVSVGTTFTLPANGFTAPNGYKFYGWFVEGYSNPLGSLAPGDDVVVGIDPWPGTVTVTAVWVPTSTVTINFEAGGGTGTMTGETVAVGATFTLPANGFTAPDGYEFYGWFVEGYSNPLGILAPGDDIVVGIDPWPGTVTVTALWEPVTFTVKFYWNYDNRITAITEAESVLFGEFASDIKYDNDVLLDLPVRSEYTFIGWCEDLYDYEIGPTPTNYRIFTAQWVPDIEIAKIAYPLTAEVGDTIIYTITVTNTSVVSNVYDLVVVDELDSRLSLVPGSVNAAYIYSNGELRVILDKVPMDSSVVITFEAIVLPSAVVGQIIYNTATLEDSIGNQLVDILDYPLEAICNGVEIVGATGPADTTITKAANRTTAVVGNTITYTIRVANTSVTSNVYDLVVIDNFNIPYVSFVSNSVNLVTGGGTVAGAVYSEVYNNELQVTIDKLPAGGYVVITFDVTVLSAAAGERIYNTAVLEDSEGNRTSARCGGVAITRPGGGPTGPSGGGSGGGHHGDDTTQPPSGPGGIFTNDHIAYLVGFPDGTIRPNSTITRAEVATIFFRLLDDNYRTQMWRQSNPFRDVASANWFNNAVSTLANADIVEGFPDGTFRGTQAITRAEFVTIVARFLDDTSYAGSDRFNDISGHWAREYINAVGQHDWIVGFGGGDFRPNQSITRAEAAAIVNRMLNRQPQSVYDLLPDMVTWPDNMNENAWFYLYIQEATNSHDFEMKADGVHERWTELKEPRDWTSLERPNSRPHDIL